LSLPVWTIRCTYGEGAIEKRDAALAAHEAYLVAHGPEIRFAGPMFADDGATRTGLWLLIDAPDRAGAEAFIAEEGFNRAGMFGAIEIKRFVAIGLARRQVEIVPDLDCRMFVCELVGGAVADDALDGVADRAVARGLIMTDDGSRLLGAVAIVEVADRAAAEILFAADPPVGASDIRIDRWRFGKSVV
jgi:uncharacterized protein YciI